MQATVFDLLRAALVLTLPLISAPGPASTADVARASAEPGAGGGGDAQAWLRDTLDALPLTFVENQGQLDQRVDYYVRGRDKTIYFTPDGVTYALTDAEAGERWTVKLGFVDANPGVHPVGERRAETTISTFRGPPEAWQTDLPTYRRVVYRDLWPGIDLAYQGTANKLKYAFIVHPGADPGRIRLAYRGARVEPTAAGQLEVTTPVSTFRDQAPTAYQEMGGRRDLAVVDYAVNGNAYGFEVSAYDPDRPLVIDPAVLVTCGYIGGSFSDFGHDVAVDKEGNAYVVGEGSPESNGFPVTVGPDLTFNGGSDDAFVAKVRADGTGLVYCGYIGGSDRDWAWGVAVDDAGSAYVVGRTYSSQSENFPVTGGPGLSHSGGYGDAYVAKVTPDGTDLDYCGYIGGSEDDWGYDVAVDQEGNAYVVGRTESTETDGFPVAGGPDTSYNGGYDDAYVAKVTSDGSALDYCGYIGGSEADAARGVAVDEAGGAYVVGDTGSSPADGFPVVVGPELTHGGNRDAFVARVTADGSDLAYCGYVGGSGDDGAFGAALDASDRLHVVGETASSPAQGFAAARGPSLTYGGGYDAFVTRVLTDGSDLAYCGYIGGSEDDWADGVAVDDAGSAYVVGTTWSSTSDGFPARVGPDLTYNGGDGDAFVTQVLTDGSGLAYCGYVGGSKKERGEGAAVDEIGGAYLVGTTESSESNGFPLIVGPSLTHAGHQDVFVARVGDDPVRRTAYVPLVIRADGHYSK